jgi:myo-inositol-1(or 4)-monophosphatase
MHPTLNIAVKAARRAGGIINRASRDVEQIKVSAKRDKDFVTEVDKAAEEAIHRRAERGVSGPRDSSRGVRRLRRLRLRLDHRSARRHHQLHPRLPAVRGLHRPAHKGVLQHAVVYDPTRNELFTASKGAGAYLNESAHPRQQARASWTRR